MNEHPYGSWPSPLAAADLAGATVRLGGVAARGLDSFWIEGRAAQGGLAVLVRRSADGAVTDVSPATGPDGQPFSVRSRVHEYGGGAYAVAAGLIVCSRSQDDRLYRIDDAGALTPLTPADGRRFADLQVDPKRGVLFAVCEDHGQPGGFTTDPVTTIVTVPLDGSAAATGDGIATVIGGADFYMAPRLSPDGAHLAYVTWDHPNMPWDGSRVCVLPLTPDGAAAAEPTVLAGGATISAQEPVWTPAGDVIHIDDSTGWWNVYRTELAGDGAQTQVRTRHLHPANVEFSTPQWTFDARTIAVLDDDHLVLSWTQEGRRRLGTMRIANGELEAWVGEWEPDGELAATPDRVLFVGAHPRRHGAIVQLDLADGSTTVLAQSSSIAIDDSSVSQAEAVSWDAGDGEIAHGFFYPPRLAGVAGPADQLPPLLVFIHGGPTASTSPGLSAGVQFWTTRGFAVLDVNYGGSTGYGREYRERLCGSWGIVDVNDCATGAQAMARAGKVDGARLAIRGGSAGGFTTLAALAFTDVFAAGTSRYGIGDLAALAQQTHKFEARYLDGLVGPYPQDEQVYRDRSPRYHVDRINAPVLLLQGAEDKVVPPEQSIAMAQALTERGVPVSYVQFDGEGHGFRGAEAIETALQTELAFYGQVFGFATLGSSGASSQNSRTR